MSTKYSLLPTHDSQGAGEHKVDFSSAFTYDDTTRQSIAAKYPRKKYPKYFSYTFKDKYRSIHQDGIIASECEASVESVDPGVVMRCCAVIITFICYAIVFVTFPISVWICLKKVQEYERVVVYRLGRLLAVKGAGKIIILPCIDTWTRVDVRTRAFSIPPLKVLTSDNGALEIGGEVYFNIKDPILSVGAVKDVNYSMRSLAQTVLQRHLGSMPLAQIEMEKYEINQTFTEELNKAVTKWGITISKIEMSPMKVLVKPNSSMPGLPGGGPNPMTLINQLLNPQAGDDKATQPRMIMPPGFPMPQIPGMSGLMAPLPGQTAHSAKEDDPLLSSISVEEPPLTAGELVQKVAPYLTPDIVREFGVVYKFRVIGDPGPGVYYLDLKNGRGAVGSGEPPCGSTDVTITISQEDMVEMFNGKLNAFHAYMRGDLKIDGDLRDATSLQELIEKIRK